MAKSTSKAFTVDRVVGSSGDYNKSGKEPLNVDGDLSGFSEASSVAVRKINFAKSLDTSTASRITREY